MSISFEKALTSRPHYTILYSSPQEWRWHPIPFKKVGKTSHHNIPYYMLLSLSLVEVASTSLSRRWVRHPHLAVVCMCSYTKVEVASPCLCRKWPRHPHLTLNILDLLLLCRGGGGFDIPCKELG